MRKLLFPAAVVIVLAIAAGFFLLKRRTVRQVIAAELLPAETVFFAELPNVARTLERWPRTALHALWHEPEVQAFLEQPREKLPWLQESTRWLEALARMRPEQGFFAVAGMDGDVPRIVAGISFLGSRSSAETLLAGPRAALKDAWPTGRTELITYGAAEIQTFTEGERVVAECFRESWYFAANQLDLLKATLDRYDTKANDPAATLASREAYRESLAALPKEPDLAIFAQPAALLEKVSALLNATGQQSGSAGLAEIAKIQGFGAAMKMEGREFRDAWFTCLPGATDSGSSLVAPAPAELARRALNLTTAETALFHAAALPPGFGAELERSPLLPLVPSVERVRRTLEADGLKLAEALDALGPEISVILDWPQDGMLAPCLAAELRDPEKVRAALAALNTANEPSAQWKRFEENGTVFFQPPDGLLPQFTPTLALTDRFLLFTIGRSKAAEVAALARGNEAALPQTALFKSATAGLPAATEAFSYLNTSLLVTRAYGFLRPTLAMSLALNPDAASYIDAGKLPAGEILAKHLGSTAYAKRVTAKGIVSESMGPLTYDQAVIGAALISGAASLPFLKETLQKGTFGSALVPTTPRQPAPPATPGAPPALEPARPQPANPAGVKNE